MHLKSYRLKSFCKLFILCNTKAILFIHFTESTTSPDSTPGNNSQLHPSSAFTFKSLLDNLGQSKNELLTSRPPNSSPSSATSTSESNSTGHPMIDQNKVSVSNSALQIPRTSIPLLPGSSTLSVNHASYLLASQGYYSANGASAGMYLGHGMVPPTLLYPQLYQQSHLQTSIHLLGNDATRNSYDASTTSSAHQESQQGSSQGTQELLNKEVQSPRVCTDEPRLDSNGHTVLSPRERLGSLRLNASRTAQNEVTTVWRPY